MKKILLLMTMLTTSLFASTYTIQSATTKANLLGTSGSPIYGQSFKTQNAGSITHIKVGVVGQSAFDFTLRFYQGEYNSESIALYSETFSFAGVVYQNYQLTTPLSVSANTLYSFKIDAVTSVYYSSGQYANGRMAINNSWGSGETRDLNFVITVEEVTPEAPTLSTVEPSAVSYTTVQSGGTNINQGTAEITQKGLVWSASSEPTLASHTGGDYSEQGGTTADFSQTVSGLSPATTYYIRAYATNSVRTSYGNSFTFSTLSPAITGSASAITQSSAALAGEISNHSDLSAYTFTERGIVLNTSGTPTTADTKIQSGSGKGTYNAQASSLTAGTDYYYRAYGISGGVTYYGETQQFTTRFTPPGTALSITGNTEAVDISTPITLGSDWTISLWIKNPLGNSNATLLRGENDSHIRVSGNIIGTQIGDTFYASNINLANLSNGWYHLAVVGSGSTTAFYLFGESQGSAAAKSSDAINRIGNHSSGAEEAGILDEIQVWNAALSASQITEYAHQALEGDESNLLAYYPCDANGGTTVTDIKGSHHGAIVNSSGSDWLSSNAALSENATVLAQHDIRRISQGYSSGLESDGLNVIGGTVTGSNYLIYGHNNLSGTSSENLSTGLGSRLARVWYIESLGVSSPTLYIQRDNLNAGFETEHYELLKSANSNMSDAVSLGKASTLNTETGIVGFSTSSFETAYYTLAMVNDQSLPVTLESFTAKAGKEGVLLEWESSAEIENAGFVIRRQETVGRSQENGETDTSAPLSDRDTEDFNHQSTINNQQLIASYLTEQSLAGQGSVTKSTHYTFTDSKAEPGKTYIYTLSDVDFSGKETELAKLEIKLEAEGAIIAENYTLRPVYPNPFNASFTIPFSLTEAVKVQITLYDVNGRKVLSILNQQMPAGDYQPAINADHLPSGTYFLKIAIDRKTHTQKISLMK
jgi:hypothetical protein